MLESSDHRPDEISRGQDFRDATPDRLTICHSNYIQRPSVMRRFPGTPRFTPQQKYPEARIRLITDFPSSEIATGRRMREYPSRMKTLRNPTQASCQAIPDHGRKYANRPVQLIAGPSHFRATSTVATPLRTGPAKRRAGRVPSLPTPAIHPLRQPAIPDGGTLAENDKVRAI